MNETEIATIVERIVGTWPNGPRGFVWTEAFNDHPEVESRTAGAAYRALRDGGLPSHERITIARFLAEERRQRGYQPAATPTAPVPDDGPTMSHDEFITRLIWRANSGDHAAGEQLDIEAVNAARSNLGRPA